MHTHTMLQQDQNSWDAHQTDASMASSSEWNSTKLVIFFPSLQLGFVERVTSSRCSVLCTWWVPIRSPSSFLLPRKMSKSAWFLSKDQNVANYEAKRRPIPVQVRMARKGGAAAADRDNFCQFLEFWVYFAGGVFYTRFSALKMVVIYNGHNELPTFKLLYKCRF